MKHFECLNFAGCLSEILIRNSMFDELQDTAGEAEMNS